MVVVHELVHGLGFASRLINNNVPSNINSQYMTPQVLETGSKSYFEPPSIFDSLIFGGDKSVLELTRKISNLDAKECGFERYMEEFEKSSVFEAGLELYKLFTSDNLRLVLRDNDVMDIHNPGAYSGPSTASHLVQSYSLTDEFLMVPQTLRGQTLTGILSNLNQTNVFGPKLLKVLEMIGFERNESRRGYDGMEMVQEFGTSEYEPSSGGTKGFLGAWQRFRLDGMPTIQ